MDDNTNTYLNKLSNDLLPEPYKTYVEAIGIEGLYNLTRVMGGKTIYVPKDLRGLLRKLIISEFDSGISLSKLAKKYSLSLSTVYRMVK